MFLMELVTAREIVICMACGLVIAQDGLSVNISTHFPLGHMAMFLMELVTARETVICMACGTTQSRAIPSCARMKAVSGYRDGKL